jgi:hypothetical protein
MGSAAGLETYLIDTPRGTVSLTAENRRPAVLMIHGFKRRADQLLDWRERIPGLGFVHLPGHGGAPPLDEVSVRAWVDALSVMMDLLAEPPLIIAESLGAVVALALRARAVVAVEPVLSTHQLWPLRRTIDSARARGMQIEASDEALFAEPFDWVLETISAPAMVLAGAMPLLPERDVRPEPSLLTNEDLLRYAAHPCVEAAFRLPGGHGLLIQNPEGVMAAAGPFFARHGWAG